MQIQRPAERSRLLRAGLRLEYLTVGWNVVEGIVSVAAAVAAGSVVLLGFGIDSFVESASGGILIWRLLAERRARDHDAVERIEHRARRLVGASLFALASYVALDAAWSLSQREQPESSPAGIAVTAISFGVMWWLARAKRDVARRLGSRALEADAFQTTACWWLSLVALCGLSLNGAFGWWWADPVAAIGAAYFIGREALGAWRGDDCCDVPATRAATGDRTHRGRTR
jgi:divalent metal cation (Fe/Co/Zn/Cd) transporter